MNHDRVVEIVAEMVNGSQFVQYDIVLMLKLKGWSYGSI